MARIYGAAVALAAIALGSAYALSDTVSEMALLSARYTARVSFLMFLLVVSAGPAARYFRRNPWTWLARRRRHLGLAFAGLMMLHLLALAINVLQFRPRELSEVALGGLVYVLIVLMALTSNDAAQRRMGKYWRWLHWVGVNAIVVTFTVSYTGRIFEPDYFWTGLVFAPFAIAALALRLEDALRRLR
ncbi:ferric reductase-like transmembrane domain-containing protein [Aurantiacibacter sp. D1-12]|uniref:ferric reductase-like transmembrane domain-containing protein n=1 Tax=Aurantiacibacter sp. D1-12 TaxID=2993658 RepID=UPI00237C5FFC|nr:ferric reductase-like transmembrane domain-containing protein [Aurantiacibacter sp. D1-12]MDE1467377.1 ferric reductase-like transmembrane domain-containing protein [Aurantiacibacter sp. D1-12]